MRGSVTEIYRVYDGKSREIVIPVYQRNYNWSTKQCERLFTDIEEILHLKRPKHFFGAVVGNPESSWTWVVIDGQQRLTTVSLLMLALSHAIAEDEIEFEDQYLGHKIVSDYLLVDDGASTKFKLKPIKDDASAYKNLFDADAELIETSNVTLNYRYFRDRLRQTRLTADQVWEAICRLEVMQLDLEGHDEPQRIFESLNSTGMALSEADKIRNLVLMDLDNKEQTKLYENYWNPLEKNVNFETDWFIRWYLVTKTRKTPNQKQVYEAFKTYLQRSDDSILDILRDMHEYSQYCRKLQNADTGIRRIDTALTRYNRIMGDVILPFLMPVFADQQSGEIDEDDFIECIRVLESYIFRRVTCEIAANALNKIFATAYGDLRKLRTNQERYSDILKYLLKRRDGGGRFPTDEEFLEAFQRRNSYKLRPAYRQYMFDCLENRNSNDTRDIAGALTKGVISVEHVMPQTLTETWKKELGADFEEVHSTWVNRIANLTVTGYNSKYSNSTFEKKKSVENGFDDSPYRLNSFICQQATWGLAELEERSKILTRIAASQWEYPLTDFEPPKTELPQTPLGDDTSFTGRAIVAFQLFDTRETVSNWADMMPRVISLLLENYKDELFSLSSQQAGLRVYKTASEKLPRGFSRAEGGLAVFVSSSTDEKCRLLRWIFDRLQVSTDDLTFTLRPLAQSTSEEKEPEQSIYAPLTKYLDEFDEFAAQLIAPDDTSEIRMQFLEDFSQFSAEDPMSLLGSGGLPSFSDQNTVKSADFDQILAAIDGTIMMSKFDPQALHRAIDNGTASMWLRRLQAA